ncbi:hypothetical protein HDU76_002629, partial [Blyttiomyces sp. JEL0837]
MTIFSNDIKLGDDITPETFRTVILPYKEMYWLVQEKHGQMVWQVLDLNLLVNAEMIPTDSVILLKLLEDYLVRKTFGYRNVSRKVSVNYDYVCVRGDPDSPDIIKRICDFVKDMGLDINMAVFSELQKLPFTRLDLYQNLNDPAPNLLGLSKMTPTLRSLKLASAWRHDMMIIDTRVRPFTSLYGVELLPHLQSLRDRKELFDGSQSKNLKFELRTIKNVEVVLEAFPDFLDQLEDQLKAANTPTSNSYALHSIQFKDNMFELSGVPMTGYDLSKTILRVTALMLNLRKLEIHLKLVHTPSNLLDTLPLDVIMAAISNLDRQSNRPKYLAIWVFNNTPYPEESLMISEEEFNISYAEAANELCEERGIRMNVQ